MLQAGARDYVTKPFDIAELVHKVRTAVGVPDDVMPAAGADTDADPDADGSTLGTSAAMRGLALKAKRVAARARTVLITDESGAGKEVLAREMHA